MRRQAREKGLEDGGGDGSKLGGWGGVGKSIYGEVIAGVMCGQRESGRRGDRRPQ